MTKQSNRGGLRNPPGGRPRKPPEEKYIAINLRLPPAILEWLNAHTENRNGFIVEAIKEKIEKV